MLKYCKYTFEKYKKLVLSVIGKAAMCDDGMHGEGTRPAV